MVEVLALGLDLHTRIVEIIHFKLVLMAMHLLWEADMEIGAKERWEDGANLIT